MNKNQKPWNQDISSEAEAAMRAFFDQPAGLHLICQLDGTIERVNLSWKEALGYSPQELEGLNFQQFIHPDDLEATRIEMEHLGAGEPVTRFQNRYRHKDGSWRTLMWWASMPSDVNKIYAIAHDLTDIQDSRERLELALSGADLGTWDWHIPSGHVVFNKRWATLLGYRPDEIEPHVSEWERFVHPDDMPAVEKLLQDHLDGKTDSYESEHRLRHKDDRWIWVLDKGRVIERDEHGSPLRAYGTHLDISDRKNAELEAKQARERLKYINLILNTIRDVNQLITRQKGSGNFLQPVCETIVAGQGLYNAWIALLDPESGEVTETHAAGEGINFTPLVNFLQSEGLPFCARQALTSDTPIIISEPTPQCPDCPCAYEHADKARIVQRLKCDDQVYGVLSLAAPARFATDSEELGLIQELGGDLAFALKKAETKRKLDLTEFALENSSDTVFWIASDGRFFFVNKAACEQLGYTQEELLSMSVADVDPDFPAERWPQHWAQMKAAGSMRFETHHQTKDGRVFPVEVYGSFIERDDQEYIFAFVHDISTRVQQEQAMEEANRELDKSRLAALNMMEDAIIAKENLELTQFSLDHAADTAFWINEDASFSYVNEAACKSLGYSRDELLRMSVLDIDPSVDEKRWKQLWDQVQQKGSISVESSHRTKDGRIIPVEVHSNTMTFQGKTRHFAFAHDISNRKQAEEKIKASEAQYRNLFKNMTSGFALHEMIFDKEGRPTDYRFLQTNPAFEELTGLSADRIIGRTAKEILPDTETHWIETYETVVCTGEPVAFENYSEALGKYFGVRAFRPAPGQFAVIVADITERKRLEEALEKRIVALTRPLEDSTEIAFEELFDLKEIQRIQNEFAAATGVASIITHPDGTPITEPSNFTDLCAHVIRGTETGCANCYKSDAALGKPSTDGPLVKPCLSGGLWDAGASIMVGGKHIANWLIGQVRNETQTEEQMLAYARKIGADEEVFLEAFHRVPSMTREQFDKIAQALFTLANQLSTSAYQNMQQARFIADQKKTEAELRRLSTAIEQSPESVMITDSKGTIQYINPAFETMTGYKRDEVIGKTPRILKSEKHPDAFYSNLWKTIKSGIIWSDRFINKRKDGSLYTEESSISPVRDATGAISNYVAIKRDITDELAREAHLQQSQKMEAVGQLAGGIAHDFNNILQAILGFSELLMPSVEGQERSKNNVLEIQKAAKHAADLTRQLLTFSRKQPVQFTLIDLNKTVNNTLKIIEIVSGEKVKLKTNLAPDLQLIHADNQQIERVIINIALNARDAMPNGGELIFRTEQVHFSNEDVQSATHARAGDFACLSISDTGSGMSEETAKHIFEPFFSTKAPGKGTGLGLASVYGIVEQHKGWISVYSELNQGTTFKIYLPLHSSETDPSETTANEETTDHVHGKGEKILVVEDDPAIRSLAETALQNAGYIAVTATSAAEAKQIFTEEKGGFDLLFSDVVLPDENGTELAETLLKNKPGLRILLCSGYSGGRIQQNAFFKKHVFFLEKPFSIVNLLKTVHQALTSNK